MKLEERLLSKMIPDPNTGCWLWTASTQNSGYGKIKIDGKTIRAHRASYSLFKGKIPEGLLVCHRCDTRSCINPEHLFLGDQKDNIADCLSKGRFRGGKHHINSKITEKLEKEILASLATGISQHKVAKMFDTSRSLVCAIKMGTRWSERPSKAKLRGLS